MRIFTILLILLVTQLELFGQHLPDILISSPVFIEHSKGTGTGFLMVDSTQLYFITARHNFIDLKNNTLLAKEATLTTYKEDPSTGDKIIYKIDLASAFADKLIITTQSEDVLILKMADLIKAENGKFSINYHFPDIQKMTKSIFLEPLPVSIIENYDDVHIGDDIFIFGYPTSIGLKQIPQFDYSRPLLRKGIVGGKYDKNKTLILDCPSYPGNSGGPVIAKNIKGLTSEYKLVGIVVQFIPYEEQWLNVKSGLVNTDRFNSGYSVAVSGTKILELLDKN